MIYSFVHSLWMRGVIAALAVGFVPATTNAQVLRGVVREVVSQRPLPGVSVSLLDAKDSVLRFVASGRAGDFVLNDLAPGMYSLSLRSIGFEPLLTTPFRIVAKDTVILAFSLDPIARALDTVRVKGRLLGVTPGRQHFAEHYQRGLGLFISGAEIEASRKGIGAYVAALPGFSDYGGGKPPATNANECRTINAMFRGGVARLNTERIGAGSSATTRLGGAPGSMDSEDLCSLTDEMGRRVFSVDAPCVITQVDRLGWVSRVVGNDLFVQPLPNAYMPLGGGPSALVSEPDAGTRPQILVHLKEVIGVELFRSPREIPDNLRIRGNSIELEAKVSRCGLIQFWTRAAW